MIIGRMPGFSRPSKRTAIKWVELDPPWRPKPQRRLTVRAALRAAFSSKTKLIVLNSPMNPTGKVLKRELRIRHAGLLTADKDA